MKVIILIILISITYFNATAQSLFAPVMGAKWTYIYRATSFQGFTGVSSKSNGIYKAVYDKDTIVNSLTYKLINLSTDILDSLNIPILPINGPVKYRDTVILKKTVHKMFFRENNDTLWAAIDFISNERLYFIFKSKPDSFNISKNSQAKVFIDSIYLKEINGKKLKTWKGKSYSRLLPDGLHYDTCSLTFVERIGIIDDLMPYFAFGGHRGNIDKRIPWGLVCYEDKEIGLVKFINLDCDIKNRVSTKNVALEKTIDCTYDSEENKISYDMHDLDTKYWKIILIDLEGNILLDTPIKDKSGFVKIQNRTSLKIGIVHFYNTLNGNYFNKKILIH